MATNDRQSSDKQNTHETQSTANRPKAGDGTLLEERNSVQPNWHGASQRPHEEFINDVDARPTRPETQNTKNLSGDLTEKGPSADDVFPAGGPEAQSDG